MQLLGRTKAHAIKRKTTKKENGLNISNSPKIPLNKKFNSYEALIARTRGKLAGPRGFEPLFSGFLPSTARRLAHLLAIRRLNPYWATGPHKIELIITQINCYCMSSNSSQVQSAIQPIYRGAITAHLVSKQPTTRYVSTNSSFIHQAFFLPDFSPA